MRYIYAFIITLFIGNLGFGQTTILSEDFETDGDGTRYSVTGGFTDGGGDYFVRTNGTTVNKPAGLPSYNSQSSSFYFAAEDTQDGGNPNSDTSDVTFNDINISGFTNITIEGLFACGGKPKFDPNDYMHVYIDVDNTGTWTLIGAFEADISTGTNSSNFGLDADLNGQADGPAYLSTTFGSYSFNLGTTGNLLDVKIEVLMHFGDEEVAFDLIEVKGTSASSDTTVQFASASATVNEGSGTYDLILEIANEDAVATSVDIVLTSGDASGIDNYTTQTVTFAGSSSLDETQTITITDDGTYEENESITFTLQNATGGNNATIGSQDTFTLTIENNDTPPTLSLPYSEDFSDCATAKWITYDEVGNQTWTCSNGEFVMNGFPDLNDRDWLISNFSIDFDAQENENIAVTTIERYGDTVNQPGEFQLGYSTDYDGLGDPTAATWLTLSFDPNNTSSNNQYSAESTTIVDASSITGTAYIAFIYDAPSSQGSPEEWKITEILIQEGALPTEVEFATTAATVNENSVSYDLEFTIANEDDTNATSFDVVLTSGDATDINSYITQTVNFVAGSTANQTVTITITNDAIEETDETFTFEIQNVSGGNSAAVGSNNSFNLTILANDATAGWQISSEDAAFTVDFDNTVSDVNNGTYAGLGFTANPSEGELDSDAWAVTGLSDGTLAFSGTGTTGDFTGTSTGGTSGGGLYSFNTGGSNQALGFQPTSSDFSPGTITLRAQNQTGSTVTSADISYLVFVYNDQDRSSYFNFSYSTDNTNYTPVSNLNLLSTESKDLSPAWASNFRSTVITGISVASGEYLYLKWETDDVSGTGSRDEIALDDITLKFNPTTFNYTYVGTWFPSNPNGNSTVNDDIVISSGDAIISSNTTINGVTINAGAGLTVNNGIELTTNTIDLESTSSSYASLINNGTITGTITYNRYTNTIGSGSTGGNDLIASPFSGQTFGAFATANDGVLSASGTLRAFAPFNTGSGNYENYDTSTDNATEIEAGTGYRAATDSGESLAFSGTLNSGDITVSLSDGASSYWNLIGNVYPSYLDLGDFLATNDNTIIQDAFYGIYGYDANASDGSVFTIWDLNTDGDFLIAPGQGFFVAAPSGGGTSVTFTESMRRTGVADDFIVGRGQNNTGVTRAGINLNTASKSYVTNFYFRDINTLGLDPGYDTGAFDQESDGLFSNLVANDIGIALVNQSLPLESLSNVSIPLVVNATAGEQLNFSLDSNTSLPANIEVYLEDILTGTSTLLNTSDYIFTPTSNLSGPGRFYVVFSDNALGVNEDSLNNINIYALERELFIKGQLAHNTNATLFDMQGRAVLKVSLDTESQINTIDISGLSNGIYIVQLSDMEYSKSKKVILK